MKVNSLLLLFFIFSAWPFLALCQYDPTHRNNQKFVLNTEIPPGYDIQSTSIATQVYNRVEYTYTTQNATLDDSRETEKLATWQFNTVPKWVNLNFITSNRIVWYLAEPGDSINIDFIDNKPVFTGEGSKNWELIYTIHRINDSLDQLPEKQNLSKDVAASPNLEDYFAWNDFLNFKASIILPVIEKYKPLVSPLSYTSAKDYFISFIECRRLWKFNYLRIATKPKEKNQYGLTNADICKIYDSTMKGSLSDWLINKTDGVPSADYLWQMMKLELYRNKNSFFKTSETSPPILGIRQEDPYILQYALVKEKYQGIKRATVLGYPFYNVKGIFDALGFTKTVDSLLNDFYAQQGFEEIKEGVKIMEEKFREKYAKVFAPSFELEDLKGQTVSLNQLRGKIVIIDFWFTGCAGCVQMAPALHKVSEELKNDSNIVFVSISVDKDKTQWKNSIQKRIFTTGDRIQLYTGGIGNKHAIIKDYYINSFPSLCMIDPGGKIIVFNNYKIDPRKDGGKSMTALLVQLSAQSKDGPYIYYNQTDSITTYNFSAGIPKIQISENKQKIENLHGYTDLNQPFRIKLQKELSSPPSVFKQPSKMLILSDIEGEFAALKNLLVNNKVIDSEFNWTFGDGHLVFAGDMFDRGNQVTECLWLIYTLEEKAKAQGGFVHFILGNHEIMNLQGDLRYAASKYKENAAAINKTIKLLYGPKSELGKWLRTKNIIEKIGDLIILHGGVSSQVNALPLTLDQINKTGRLCYDCSTVEMRDTTQKLLLSGHESPLWNRSYYYDIPGASPITDIDNTLKKFDAQYIITGHSVIADTISVIHNQKVINTDTKHAEGKSEALLILGNSFYRVNQEGTRKKLFDRPTK